MADLDRLETVCEWLKDRAGERSAPRIAQRADDVSHVAQLRKRLLLRGSPFAEPVGRAMAESVRQELRQRAGDPDVQDAITQAQQTLTDVERALGRQGRLSAGSQQAAFGPQRAGQQPSSYQQTGQPTGSQRTGQQPVGSQQPTGQQGSFGGSR